MKSLIFYCLFLITIISQAQTDTLYSLDKNWIAGSLKEGTHQYMVFLQNKLKPKITDTQLWTRSIKFKIINGKEVIEIKQQWSGSDSARYRSVYSLVDRNTFLPIHHRTWAQRTGTEAYDFYPDKIVGSDTVGTNTKKNFSIGLTKTALNWELDLETFGLLPLKTGKRFAMSFYHPGGRTEPMLYDYKVIGETILAGSDGAKVPCWKLKIDYGNNGSAIFYISKKTKEVVRMEEDFGPITRYKVKLPTTFLVK